jgi:DNA-binding CsgD family transcriptional regulator
MIISAENIRIEKHHIGKSADDMLDLTKPLTRQLGITSFSYVKLWPNHVESYLTSHPDFCQAYYDLKLYKSPGIGNPLNYESGYYETSTSIYKKYFRIAADYNLHNFFIVAKRTQDACEMFIFATDKNNPFMNNIYINNLDILDSHISHFKNTARRLIAKADKNQILFPGECKEIPLLLRGNQKRTIYPSLQGNFVDKNNPGISKSNPNILTQITPRELNCVELLTKGFTAKETALTLDISYRTVEKYLERLKQKFGCKNVTQLAAIMAHISQNNDQLK